MSGVWSRRQDLNLYNYTPIIISQISAMIVDRSSSRITQLHFALRGECLHQLTRSACRMIHGLISLMCGISLVVNAVKNMISCEEIGMFKLQLHWQPCSGSLTKFVPARPVS